MRKQYRCSQPIGEQDLDSLHGVGGVLRHRGRSDLAALLDNASIEFDVSSTYGSLLFSQITTAEIYAPLQDYERLKSLSPADGQAILDAILEIWPPRAHNMEITTVVYRLDPSSLEGSAHDNAQLLQQIDSLRNLMIAVSTGGPRIDSVNAEYRSGYDNVDQRLRELELRNPNPYRDLWDWYGKWSSGDLPTYRSRREYIRGLFAPLEVRLREGPFGRGAEVFEEPTGWSRVDRALGEMCKRLEEATSEEQFQAVGLICRESMISLAKTVYEPDRHVPTDGTTPSASDAKRMLDAYLAVELSGRTHEAARKHAKAALDLANNLQHRRTATFREAALCAEATSSVVNLIAIVSGQRDPGASGG